jgi:hypothetical protein
MDLRGLLRGDLYFHMYMFVPHRKHIGPPRAVTGLALLLFTAINSDRDGELSIKAGSRRAQAGSQTYPCFKV